ncbi:uncharacterized protein LOC141648995 [Silene latifolia]|uniref:uncharacterized protein LOC141648995 n=1 Tax=Silene latifolia TaxID=37657 RepID=UPI003D76EFAD
MMLLASQLEENLFYFHVCSEEDANVMRFYAHWKAQFHVDGQVDIKTLAEHIICHDDYSDQFKINFVVLAVSLLMRNNQKPFVNHHVLKSLRNVSAIGQLDWCQFVMESLRYNTKDWVKKGKKNHFGGPLLFLMLVYVDRVVHEKRFVERDYYTLLNWTSAALFSREKQEMEAGQFGLGRVKGRLMERIRFSNPCRQVVEKVRRVSRDVSTDTKSPISYSSPEEFADDYTASAKRVMEDMVVLDEKYAVGLQCFQVKSVSNRPIRQLNLYI